MEDIIGKIEDLQDELRDVTKEISKLEHELEELRGNQCQLEWEISDYKAQLREPRNLHQKFRQ
jgi:predicted  nucleic acid-binding Zn-ribbon protein